MKVPTVSLAAILVMCVTSFSCGEEEQKQQSGSEAQAFTITMKGVTWGGCKRYVREAFSKLDGVVCEDAAKDIKITNGKDRGTQTVVLKTTGELTKELAITAIGERHKKFIVIAVKQGQPIVEDVEEEGADEAGKKKRRRGDREKGSSRKRQSREKDEAKTEKKAEA